MLQRLSVKNYKTFYYKTGISMKAQPYGHLPDMVMDNGLLRIGMIFGANNVGKSKLIDALRLIRDYACLNDRKDADSLLTGSILGNWGGRGTDLKKQPPDFLDENTEISIDILIEESGLTFLYRYTLTLRPTLKDDYTRGKLYSDNPDYTKVRYRVVSETIKLCRENDKWSYRFVYYKIGEESRLSDNLSNQHANRVYNWLKNDLIIIDIRDQFPFESLQKPEYYLYNLNEVVRCMDVGIDRLEYADNGYRVVHTGGWKSDVSEESEGTRRIIGLGPALIPGYDGKTIVIDELNRKLHPDLTRRFIELFLQENEEKKQLLFTTHETRLLDDWLFRRDEIWFVRGMTIKEIEKKMKKGEWGCNSSVCISVSENDARTLWEKYTDELKGVLTTEGK